MNFFKHIVNLKKLQKTVQCGGSKAQFVITTQAKRPYFVNTKTQGQVYHSSILNTSIMPSYLSTRPNTPVTRREDDVVEAENFPQLQQKTISRVLKKKNGNFLISFK